MENICFKNYLTNRVQYVQLPCGTLSQERVATCGIPEGSVASPLLFLIYIHDLKMLLICSQFCLLMTPPSSCPLRTQISFLQGKFGALEGS